MRKLICAMVIALSVTGCATYGNKQITNDQIISEIKMGQTTKAEVKGKVGEPSKITFTDNGEEVWDYQYTRATMRAATVVPIIGIFAGGTDMETQNLTIRFNREGVVKEIGKGKMTGGAGSILD